MGVIEGKDIAYSYGYGGKALNGASFSIESGTLTVILGRNGCGKSTLIRHLNALLSIQEGQLTVGGIDVREEREIWRLRRKVGMVFQNPDNQFVSSVVGEDVAFGLENYQVPRREIPGRVSAALAAVGLAGFEDRAPHMLSGGQKQRAALAGVLALEPEILVFDEATAMLDPAGQAEVWDNIRRLREKGKTVIVITHLVEEAVSADQVLLMSEGRVLAAGTPREILTDAPLLAQAGLAPPLAVRLHDDLLAAGVPLGRCPLANEELVEELCRLQ